MYEENRRVYLQERELKEVRKYNDKLRQINAALKVVWSENGRRRKATINGICGR